MQSEAPLDLSYVDASTGTNRTHLPARATVSRHRAGLSEVRVRRPGAPPAFAEFTWTAHTPPARGTGRDSSTVPAGKAPARLRGTRPDVHQNGADPFHAPQSPAGGIRRRTRQITGQRGAGSLCRSAVGTQRRAQTPARRNLSVH